MIILTIGQALLPPLTLRQKGLVTATSGLPPLRDFHFTEFARQTFPSGLTPAVKDCFRLHGHSAFGYVAKRQIGVGQQSLLPQVQLTDPSHWLQAGKTVAFVSFASKFHRLASAFRTASVASLPAAIPSRPPCGGPTTGWRRSSCCRCDSSYSLWQL